MIYYLPKDDAVSWQSCDEQGSIEKTMERNTKEMKVMKTLIVLTVAACAVQAQARLSVYSRWVIGEFTDEGVVREEYNPTKAAAGDKYHDMGSGTYYSTYGISKDTLNAWMGQEVTKMSEATTDAVAAWMGANFNTVYTKLSSGTGVTTGTLRPAKSGSNNLVWLDFDNVQLKDVRWVIQLYYNEDDSEAAFRLVSVGTGGTDGNVVKDTATSGEFRTTNSWFADPTWTAVSIPEPTSGLLMLIGLAGLALKRKRA